MTEVSRRTFGKQTLLLSMLTAIGFPGTAMAFLDKIENDKFLQREDLADAVKSLYLTYDAFNHYPHKFNDVLVKLLIRDLDFVVRKGVEKKFAERLCTTAGCAGK